LKKAGPAKGKRKLTPIASRQAEAFIARLQRLGGKLEQQVTFRRRDQKVVVKKSVVFPNLPENELRDKLVLIFRPPRGKMPFRVGFRGFVGSDELKTQLNRANRKLWDRANDRPSAEYAAICDATEALEHIGSLPANTPVEPQSAWRMYDALRNLLAFCKSTRNAKKLSIAWTVYEQLQQEAANQPPAFFDTVSESPNVRRLKNLTLQLACKLERPPSRRELRKESGWRQDQQKEFNAVLRGAGLDWLPSNYYEA
jgi:hypothetical protein